MREKLAAVALQKVQYALPFEHVLFFSLTSQFYSVFIPLEGIWQSVGPRQSRKNGYIDEGLALLQQTPLPQYACTISFGIFM